MELVRYIILKIKLNLSISHEKSDHKVHNINNMHVHIVIDTYTWENQYFASFFKIYSIHCEKVLKLHTINILLFNSTNISLRLNLFDNTFYVQFIIFWYLFWLWMTNSTAHSNIYLFHTFGLSFSNFLSRDLKFYLENIP